MLSNVMTNSPRQGQLALSEEENVLTPANSAKQVEGNLSICRQPADPFAPIQKLYAKNLLPMMQSSKLPFVKVSRQQYEFLENSIWADIHGNIFEQYHSKDKTGVPNTDMKEKGFQGKGGYKSVWDLKPLHLNSDCPEMVRGIFHPGKCSDTLQERLKTFQKFKNEIHSEHLLIPETVWSTNFKGMEVIYQMMPKARGGDALQALKGVDRLSYLGRLRVIRSLGLGLIHMHKAGWTHLDVKPNNIMLMNLEPHNPISKLGDFDLAIKFRAQEKYYLRANLYSDPKCLNKKSSGLEDAKIHDQFSFGVTLCKLISGYAPRECIIEKIMLNFKNQKELNINNTDKLDEIEREEYLKMKMELLEWVTEDDLNEIHQFWMVDEVIQNIIRECCLGPTEDRPYKLPEHLAAIDKIIDNYTEPIKLSHNIEKSMKL